MPSMNTVLFASTASGIDDGMMSCAYAVLNEPGLMAHDLADGYNTVSIEAEEYFMALETVGEAFEDVQHQFEIFLDKASDYGLSPVRIIVCEPCSLMHLGRLMQEDYVNPITLPPYVSIVLDTSLASGQITSETILEEMIVHLAQQAGAKAA